MLLKAFGGKISLGLKSGAITVSYTSPQDSRERRCAKGFCSLQLSMETFEESEKLCGDTKAFPVMGEAEKVA